MHVVNDYTVSGHWRDFSTEVIVMNFQELIQIRQLSPVYITHIVSTNREFTKN
jgi:hypothetical protein